MLQRVFQKLDRDVAEMDKHQRAEGMVGIASFYIRVVGQTALIEAQLGIKLFATVDVDAYANCTWIVLERFRALLREEGREFDDLSSEIWMPEETVYRPVFSGRFCEGAIAEPEFVLISKALKAPNKNRAVITNYLASRPSELFLDLARKYQLKLEDFLT